MGKDDNIKFDSKETRFYGITPQDIKQWKKDYPCLDFDSIDKLLETASESIHSRCIKRSPLGGHLASLRAGPDPTVRRKVYNEVMKNPRKFLEDWLSNENLLLSITLSDKQKEKIGATKYKRKQWNVKLANEAILPIISKYGQAPLKLTARFLEEKTGCPKSTLIKTDNWKTLQSIKHDFQKQKGKMQRKPVSLSPKLLEIAEKNNDGSVRLHISKKKKNIEGDD